MGEDIFVVYFLKHDQHPPGVVRRLVSSIAIFDGQVLGHVPLDVGAARQVDCGIVNIFAAH